MVFRDRTDAGRQLAARLAKLDLDDVVVLGMARGGVPVASEIATALGAPLDVIVVRKLGHPHQPELGMGAIAEGGVRVINAPLVAQLEVPEELIDRVTASEISELERRLAAYRGDRPGIDVTYRTAVVVDDGLATGFTALAAVESLKKRGAARVIVAVPVAPPGALLALRSAADDVVAIEVSERFFGISEWYSDFSQVPDREVVRMLEEARESHDQKGPRPRRDVAGTRCNTTLVEIGADGHMLEGELALPERIRGLVVFAHGSGSSRTSPRNRAVASALHDVGLGTLLFDLLTEKEAADRGNVFDIALLAPRLEAATRWIRDNRPALEDAPIGLFGASTGAAGALVAAAHLQDSVFAVVSRGGRPDLAGELLALVTVPTLLIVGERDDLVLDLNRKAQSSLRAENRLEVVAGATHLFEEPGALEQVAHLASRWFREHLP